MDKSSKLGSYWVSEGGSVFQLLLIMKDGAGRTIFIADRCKEDGSELRSEGINTRVLNELGASMLQPYTLPAKLRPGLVLAEDRSGVTRVFLAEHYASDDKLSLWLISDESAYGDASYWASGGYVNFRMAKTARGDVFNVTAK